MKDSIKAGIVLVGAGIFAGAFGAMTLMPEKIRVETKTVEVEKRVEVEREKHKETTVVEHPDGSKETKTVEDTKTQKQTQEDKKADTVVKETTGSASKITISALGGVQAYNAFYPVYGLSISRPLIGPLVMGIWGITPGVVGVSLGLQF